MDKADFKIRPWQIADLESLVKYANNGNVAKNLMDRFPHPYTPSDGKAFLEFTFREKPGHTFAIEVGEEAVGAIGIILQTDIHQKNAELGYWLGEPFWGRGIISRAIGQIVDLAFETYDIERVFARPFGTNLASQKVLEKNNFVLEGRFEKTLFKNGEFLDELMYAIRRKNWLKNQGLPI